MNLEHHTGWVPSLVIVLWILLLSSPVGENCGWRNAVHTHTHTHTPFFLLAMRDFKPLSCGCSSHIYGAQLYRPRLLIFPLHLLWRVGKLLRPPSRTAPALSAVSTQLALSYRSGAVSPVPAGGWWNSRVINGCKRYAPEAEWPTCYSLSLSLSLRLSPSFSLSPSVWVPAYA